MIVKVPAARVRQGNLTLFSTAIKVRDLVVPGFYSVDTLDPEDFDKGYQRLLNRARANKLADYVIQGQDGRDAFLPTSVFLATSKDIPFNEAENTIRIDPKSIGPLSVVDGQHRLEGLRVASDKDERVLDMDVPVNIAINLSHIAQMCHFLIVNTTQKSVDRSVEQRIVARLTQAIQVEDTPSLPRWISRIVEKGEVDKAVRLADYLNTSPGSPWLNKIRLANADNDDATINQKSFVGVLIKYVLTPNNPLSSFKDFDKEKKVLLNYWSALKNILDRGESIVLFKTYGVEIFSRFSTPLFIRLADRGSYTVDSFQNALQKTFDNMEGEYAGVGHPEGWSKGGKAGLLNNAAIFSLVKELATALHKSTMSHNIEV